MGGISNYSTAIKEYGATPCLNDRSAGVREFYPVKKNAFYEQLNAIQEKLPKSDTVIVIGNPNTKIEFDNSWLVHAMGNHGFGDRSDDDGKFVQFCNFHRRHWYQIVPAQMVQGREVSTDRNHVSQIDLFVTGNGFWSCLETTI